ncbi:MAG: serine protease [Planctomycetota bacterium]
MSVQIDPRIDPRLVRVAKVLSFNNDAQLGNATAFFFLRDDYLFLVTNRHVVRDEASGLYPNRLQVQVHVDPDDLTAHGELWLDLVDPEGNHRWREHPTLGAEADVVAIPINDPTVIASWHVDTFGPDDLMDETRALPLGQEVIVVGFPLGFEDTVHRLPLIRRATIASVYPLPFKGDRYFVTDARLHRGSSGSPVVAKVFDMATENTQWKLLGVHSASLDVSNRDPSQDEKLGLNMTWYASLLMELTESATPNATPTGG